MINEACVRTCLPGNHHMICENDVSFLTNSIDLCLIAVLPQRLQFTDCISNTFAHVSSHTRPVDILDGSGRPKQ